MAVPWYHESDDLPTGQHPRQLLLAHGLGQERLHAGGAAGICFAQDSLSKHRILCWMIRTVTIWELWLLVALVLVVGRELVALLMARRKGLTRNVSRVVTFSSLLVLAAVYGTLAVSWFRVDANLGAREELHRLPMFNWGYPLLGVMIAVVLAYELAALVHARGSGMTSNVSRLASLSVSIVLLLVLLGISEVRWELYLVQRLESASSDSLSTGDG